MKTASGLLVTMLGSNTAILMADLYTITLHDGTILRWTSADIDIVSGGNTFSSRYANGVPLLKRGKVREVVGLEVDTLEITIMRGGALTFLNLPFPLAAANGAFDGASIKLERAFMVSWGDTPETIVRFEGNVADVKPSSTQIVLTVKSELEKLNVVLPHTVFMPQCSHALYDAGCGLSRAAFTVTGTATGTPTTLSIPSAVSGAADYYKLGVLSMTTGQAAGAKRAIKSFASGTFGLSIPLPVAPVAGDQFAVYPGCDKLQATCNTKFSNLTRFRGFPYVPRPETAV